MIRKMGEGEEKEERCAFKFLFLNTCLSLLFSYMGVDTIM